jgi:hypothetical protein
MRVHCLCLPEQDRPKIAWNTLVQLRSSSKKSGIINSRSHQTDGSFVKFEITWVFNCSRTCANQKIITWMCMCVGIVEQGWLIIGVDELLVCPKVSSLDFHVRNVFILRNKIQGCCGYGSNFGVVTIIFFKVYLRSIKCWHAESNKKLLVCHPS